MVHTSAASACSFSASDLSTQPPYLSAIIVIRFIIFRIRVINGKLFTICPPRRILRGVHIFIITPATLVNSKPGIKVALMSNFLPLPFRQISLCVWLFTPPEGRKGYRYAPDQILEYVLALRLK